MRVGMEKPVNVCRGQRFSEAIIDCLEGCPMLEHLELMRVPPEHIPTMMDIQVFMDIHDIHADIYARE